MRQSSQTRHDDLCILQKCDPNIGENRVHIIISNILIDHKKILIDSWMKSYNLKKKRYC